MMRMLDRYLVREAVVSPLPLLTAVYVSQHGCSCPLSLSHSPLCGKLTGGRERKDRKEGKER